MKQSLSFKIKSILLRKKTVLALFNMTCQISSSVQAHVLWTT